MSLWYIVSENSTSVNQCKIFRVLEYFYELKEMIYFQKSFDTFHCFMSYSGKISRNVMCLFSLPNTFREII